jgi:hypothetical protein
MTTPYRSSLRDKGLFQAVDDSASGISINRSLAAPRANRRFARALKFRTVSNRDAPLHVEDPKAFHDMHQFLSVAYPLAWGALKVEQVCVGGGGIVLGSAGSCCSSRG